jgi:hypothetical protein
MIDDEALSPEELALARRSDPSFEAMLGSVRDHVDDEAERGCAPWDFAAMLARARQIDPSVVSAQAVREAELAEPVISLAQRRAHRITRDDPELVRLVEDVRAATEHDVALRMHGVGATPPVVGAEPRRSRTWIAVAALAAAVVLAFGAIEGVRALQLGADRSVDEAVHQDGGRDPTVHEAIVDDSPLATTRGQMRSGDASSTTTPALPQPPEVIDATPREPAPIETKAAARSRRKPAEVPLPKPVEPTLAERQAALDRDAHAAWKAGDLATAERKFEELIALSGKSRLADLAWGDLFTLARRRGDAAAETAAWKRYLAAWPRGRFADDARAGLCRRDADDRGACWREYLDDFPSGAYRAQAEREAGGAP